MNGRARTISYRLLLALLLAALLLSLIPLLWAGFYAVPCADDFSYGDAAHRAWAGSGSVFAALAAALRQTREVYFGWQGSFSAVFLMSLQPAVFGMRLYALTPALMLLSLLAGLFCACRALFSGLFGLPKSLAGCLAAVAALLCIQLLPSPAQGFYWYNGAVYYTFFQGLALISLALGLRLVRRGGTGRLLLLCLLAVILGGSNYVTALFCVLAALSGIALLLLGRDRAWRRLLLPTLCLLAAFALSAAAPGNAVRQGASEHSPDALRAVLEAFRCGAVYSVRWFRLPVLGVLVFAGVLLWSALRGGGRVPLYRPVLITLYSYCLLSAMFCPCLYALGDVGDKRLTNIIYYTYILLLLVNLCAWLGFFASRRGAAEGEKKPGLLPLLASGALCLACCALFLRAGGYTSVMALGVLRSGEAQAYYAAAQQRLTVLEDPSVRDAVLEPFPSQPYLLFMDDITADAQDWRNLAVSQYYGKDSVVLRSGDGAPGKDHR